MASLGPFCPEDILFKGVEWKSSGSLAKGGLKCGIFIG